MLPFHKDYYESGGGRRALRTHFVVPSWRGGSDPHSASGKNRIQPGGATKTGYSSWERRQSVGIRSDPAPRTNSHKTVVLCCLSIKAIRSQGAVAERYVRILLSRLGGEAVTPIPRAGKTEYSPGAGQKPVTALRNGGRAFEFVLFQPQGQTRSHAADILQTTSLISPQKGGSSCKSFVCVPPLQKPESICQESFECHSFLSC